MNSLIKIAIITILIFTSAVQAQKILIPMDLKQTDHLKAYGLAYWALERAINVEWLINYRGGSFLMDYYPAVERELRLRGITFNNLSAAEVAGIYPEIQEKKME